MPEDNGLRLSCTIVGPSPPFSLLYLLQVIPKSGDYLIWGSYTGA